MVSRTDLVRRARAHLRDAEILVSEQRYAGAVYLCGYAVEIAMKARPTSGRNRSVQELSNPQF
jgi:HEPN domain-containing protein